MKKIKYFLLTALLVLLLSGCVDKQAPVFSGLIDETIYVGDYLDLMAGVDANDEKDGNVTASITYVVKNSTGVIVVYSTDAPFVFYITYTASDSKGNEVSGERIITVIAVPDTNLPIITGVSDQTVESSETYDPMTGLSVIDDVDGDITSNTVVTIKDSDNVTIASIDLSILGVYTVTYTATDSSGNTDSETITVTVVDLTLPVITAEDQTFNNNETIDVLSYASALDNIYGDVTDSITVVIKNSDNEVVTSITGLAGIYTVTYTVTDNALNTATKTITITVLDVNLPVISGVSNKIVESSETYDPMTGLSVIDDTDGDITVDTVITIKNPSNVTVDFVNLGIMGEYTVTYSATDSSGNTESLSITITVVDLTVPVITATHQSLPNDATINVLSYATASDNVDGNLTSSITAVIKDSTNTVIPNITNMAGVYTVTYTVVDDSLNVGVRVITITVLDVTAPVIVCSESTILVPYDGEVPIIGDYCTATDETDDYIYLSYEVKYYFDSQQIMTLSTTIPGEYTVEYIVTDIAGNSSTETLIIEVGSSDPVLFNLGVTMAEDLLTQFYYDVIDSDLSINDVCAKYIGDIPFDWIATELECQEGLTEILPMITGYSVGTVTKETFGEEAYYVSMITISVDGDIDYIFEVEFNFIGYEYGDVFYINFLVEPFQLGPSIIPMNLAEAELLLIEYYYDLLDESYSAEDFCNAYVMPALNNVATLQECIDGVNTSRSYVNTITINSVIEAVLYPGEEPLDGFTANITLHTTSGDVVIDLDFVFVLIEGEPLIHLFGSPVGEGGGDGEPVFADIEIGVAVSLISAFYEDLMDITITNDDFCDVYYFLNDDMSQMDSTDCIAFRLALLTDEFTFEIGPTEFFAATVDSPPYFIMTVTRTLNAEVISYDVLFFFILDQNLDVVLMTPANNAVGNSDIPGGDGPVIADVDLATAEAMIDQYYIDLIDDLMSNSVFYEKYFMLNSMMEPMTYEELNIIRTEILNEISSYEISEATFMLGQDGPSYYYVEVTKTVGDIVLTYQVMFIFIEDSLGDPMLATMLSASAGLEHSFMFPPVEVELTSSLYVIQLVEQYYADLLNDSYDMDTWCDMYVIGNPYLNTNNCLNRELYLAIGSLNSYIVTDAVASYLNGYQEWIVTVDEYRDFETIELTLTFRFILDSDCNILVMTYDDPVSGNSTFIILPVDMVLAESLIMNFYTELFDPAITNETFCDVWYMNNPLFPGTLQDCLDGRAYALTRTETYTVMEIIVYSTEPFLLYEAFVIVDDGVNTLDYSIHFFIIDDGYGFYINFMEEIIRDIPVPLIT